MAFMALLLLVIFIVIMLTGIPVGYGMGALTVISFLLLGGDLSMIPQKLFSGIDTYTYVCILLFILSADIMTVGGITKAIVTFCDKLVGPSMPGSIMSKRIKSGTLFFSTGKNSSALTKP